MLCYLNKLLGRVRVGMQYTSTHRMHKETEALQIPAIKTLPDASLS